MHTVRNISDAVRYVGCSDRRLKLFENVYPVPLGMSYNAYVILDRETALMDTADQAVSEAFMDNLTAALGGRTLDHLIIHHMEPDHGANVKNVVRAYPNVKIHCTAGAVRMLQQFAGADIAKAAVPVKEKDTLCLGEHTLTFMTAPMVHWPEVMVSFEEKEGMLFSADAFGTFGALGGSLWADRAGYTPRERDEYRRYYANIVGKYGRQVQALLKKAAPLDIKYVLPLHGPLWRGDISPLLKDYDLWSRWEGESGVVIFCGTIYGHTMRAAEKLAALLDDRGVSDVSVIDISGQDLSFLVAEAFRCRAAVFAAASYNAGVFQPMETLLHDLKAHDWQNHTAAFLENGTWAPSAGKTMRAILEGAAVNVLDETLTIRSAPTQENENALAAMADALAAALK